MKLQTILKRLQKLHPKEIDLSLSRVLKLCEKLGNPQNNLDCISIVGTNGKYSTIQVIKSILDQAGINYNIYTSPHLKKINERFVYSNKEISDDELAKLLNKIEKINNGDPITFFEILTVAFFYGAKNFNKNINIIEAGLFHRFDATNILEKNLVTIITAIGLDHLDWLPKNQRTIDRIIFEKTSSILNSKIVVSQQENDEILNKIKKAINSNKSEKIIFKDHYNFVKSENSFIYYEDNKGTLKLGSPNILGDFQLANIFNAICALRNIKELKISDQNIIKGIKKINITGRLQEISIGKLKNLSKKNKILVDGSHNILGAKMLCNYLSGLNCNIHMILGMMKNKDHKEYVNIFKNKLASLTIVDIPNQKNSINRYDLKKKIINFDLKVNTEKTVLDAISSLELNKGDLVVITGSLYLVGEVLKLN